MKIESCIKESFSVIGKESSTEDGAGFGQMPTLILQRLRTWQRKMKTEILWASGVP